MRELWSLCPEFIRKEPGDAGGIMFCKRCGLHIEIHPERAEDDE